MSQHLYAIHDPSTDWPQLIRDAGMTGWAVISEEIGDDPNNYSGHDYSDLAAYGVTPIVRLNYSHHGAGTIPLPNRYSAFAERCANFVTASPGCRHWIIGNEPNLRAERYGDVPITPASYAECFNKCRTQILHRDTQNQVMPAAIAPYNADTGWCLDYWREMLSAIIRNAPSGHPMADGLALHTYSRGGNPASIPSEDKMDAPYQSCYSGFRAYRDFLALVPAIMRALPVYITETDQLEPWADANSGWVQAAYAEIDGWNRDTAQGIYCLALYRWQNYDQWGFCQKNGVIDDFRHALTYGYQAPTGLPPTPPTPEPTPEPTPTPEPPRDIDPALYVRGVTFDFATVPAGSGYWRISKAEWLEDAAHQVGPDHHILGNVIKDARETAGVPLRVDWPSGDTIVTSKADDPNAGYNYDYAMGPSLNEYSIVVDDGAPSDIAAGIGMGYGGNPKAHSSTWLTFEWTISEGLTPLPPTPTDIQTGMVTASAGLNVRRGPDESYDVLGTLVYGSTVLHDDEQQGWLHVVDGWVSAEYVGARTQRVPPPAAQTPIPPSPGGPVHPLPGSVITQNFYENPADYIQWDLPGHDGCDLAGVPPGTPIRSLADGVVYRTDYDRDYGNYLIIAHEQKQCYSVYCHCSELLTVIGRTVWAGDQIALVGSTGNSSGDHLHLEIRLMNADGSYQDGTPMPRGRVDPRTWAAMYGLTL